MKKSINQARLEEVEAVVFLFDKSHGSVSLKSAYVISFNHLIKAI